ncbi:MAG: histidinol-phosphatase HisJ family protein [Candidatus Lokiarchaeota archaeon]|nr:histidinol-phosphatase HisJ family protein [Candidatus Lokiarchaeota archaeon]
MMPLELFDLHVHTARCHHANGTAEDMVKAAIQKGLRAIGINDHFPMAYLPPPIPVHAYAMDISEFPGHVKELKQLREQYRGEIDVLIGSEVDYYMPAVDTIKRDLEPFMDDFDYLYGSVHVVRGFPVDDGNFLQKWDEYDVDSIFIDYYQALAEMAETRMFDVVGHVDLPKKYKKIPAGNLDGRIGKTLDAIKGAGMAVEINTAGLRKPIGEMYPSPHILEMVFDKNIEITLGSDAHDPSEVGHSFDRAIGLARQIGFSSIVCFKKRRPTAVPL